MISNIYSFVLLLTSAIHLHANNNSNTANTEDVKDPCYNKSNMCSFLFFPEHNRIKYLDLNTHEVRELYIPKTKQVMALEFDMKNKCLFWSDIKTHIIGKQCFDKKTSTEILVSKDLGLVEGLAYDWISHNLYFTDSLRSTIEVIRTNTNCSRHMRKIILDLEDLEKPRGIAVHPVMGYLFWTDMSINEPCIGRSNLDGSNAKKLLSKPQVLKPNGITIDYTGSRIFWIDTHKELIASSDLNGNDLKAIIENSKFMSYPFGIALFEGNVYWNDGIFYGIYNTSKNYSNTTNLLVKGKASNFDLKIYSNNIQKETNACVRAECTHLCVGTPEQNYICLCPDELEMFNDICLPPSKVTQMINIICPNILNSGCKVRLVSIVMFILLCFCKLVI